MDRIRTVNSILDALEDKYSCTLWEKIKDALRDITQFKREGTIESILDRYKLISDVDKVD